MTSLLDDPERSRAEEARVFAEKLSDPESKRTMLRIAADYERLAEAAERRTTKELLATHLRDESALVGPGPAGAAGAR